MAANVAVVLITIPRRAATARTVLRALAPQADRVHLILNGFKSIPAWSRAPKVIPLLLPTPGGPGARFRAPLPDVPLVLYADDDFVYPSDYVARTRAALERLGVGNAVSYHGAYWTGARSRYADRVVLPYSAAIQHAQRITLLGTGLSAFHASDLRAIERSVPPAFDYEDDIWMSAACARAGIRMFRAASPGGWIRATLAAYSGLCARPDVLLRRDRAIARALKLGGWRLAR